jgi:hypothetical protein
VSSLQTQKYVRKYVVTALAGTPDVLKSLLKDLQSDDPAWDFLADPERFNLREIIAHLGDWEPIFLERMVRTYSEENPLLPAIDEEKLAKDHGYAQSDPKKNLEDFETCRVQMVGFLENLKDEEWNRTAEREKYGSITLEHLAVLTLGHDGYHMQQVAQWLATCQKS